VNAAKTDVKLVLKGNYVFLTFTMMCGVLITRKKKQKNTMTQSLTTIA